MTPTAAVGPVAITRTSTRPAQPARIQCPPVNADIRDPAAGWTGLLSGANATRSFVLLGGVAMHAAYVLADATTLPAIVADIGGIVLYAWVTTVFVVGSVGGSAIRRQVLCRPTSGLD